MGTAYAVLTSLVNLLGDLHEHPNPPIKLDEEQVVSLRSSIFFFQRFIEDRHKTSIDLGLEIRIADAARDVDDVIEARIAVQIEYLEELYLGLEEMKNYLGFLKEQVMKILDHSNQPADSFSSLDNFVVSIEDIATKIMGGPAYKFHRKQIDSICSEIRFMQGWMKDHNTVDHSLEIQIAKAAHAAEDHIKTHMVHLIRGQEDFYGSLQRAIEGLDLIRKEVNQNEQCQVNNRPRPQPAMPPVSSHEFPCATSGGENIFVVGIEDTTTKIMDKLTLQHQSSRQIISITGMGGIGKTTLALNVYNQSYIKSYFNLRAWATISNDYDTKRNLVELLHCLDRKESKESLSKMKEHELGLELHKSLFGQRYLIVLDDVWDVEAWERLRSFCPPSSGSRILITTRESTVASISAQSFAMDLLDVHKSWDLFREKVFGKDTFPGELKDIGRNITNKCRGLPLAIVVIGGHLAKSPKTQEYWEYIDKNLSSVVNSEDEGNCLKILSLSYNHLPVHLKPCFMYMGIFPEDEEIRVSLLIRLWMAEGFVTPVKGKILEEVAKDYLNDLVGRNLILPFKTSLRGEITRCKIHDLLRSLCIKEASKFIAIVPDIAEGDKTIVNGFRTLCEQNPNRIRDSVFPMSIHSLLEVLSLDSEKTTGDFSRIANLQFLKVRNELVDEPFIFSPSICLLWNLQYLIIYVELDIKAPPEIWEMSQVRHIDISYLILPDPVSERNGILRNLQSAMVIRNLSFSEDLVNCVPNIKKLMVGYNDEVEGFNEEGFTLNNVALLENLESFSCSLYMAGSITQNGRQSDLKFPHSLKKLDIDCLHWDDVTTNIGSLPLLEVLILSYCWGTEWELLEGQFASLTYLKLQYCDDLECLTGNESHFPCLEKLVLQDMPCLKEISSDVGDIPTLRYVELYVCDDSAVESAKEIADYQLGNGNELQMEVFLQKKSCVSVERLSASNFHVYPYKGIY